MAEYHVGNGLFGIYAGVFKKPGEWKDKTEVTNETINAVVQYFKDKLDSDGKDQCRIKYAFTDGSVVELSICKVKPESKGDTE
jgi:hypothetical protein